MFSFQALRKMCWCVWKASCEYLCRIFLTNLPTNCCHFHKIMSNMLQHLCVLQKVEDRVASDQELKLTELLRYYTRDIQAAKVKPSLCLCYISCITLHRLVDCIIQPSILDCMFYSYFQNGFIVGWKLTFLPTRPA